MLTSFKLLWLCPYLFTESLAHSKHEIDGSQSWALIGITQGAFKNIDVQSPAQTHETGTSGGWERGHQYYLRLPRWF